MKTIAIVATSLDGYITKHDSEGATFTSAADQKYFRETLKTFDCCIMGSSTFKASKEMILKSVHIDRLRLVWTRTPETYSPYEQPDRLEFSSDSLKNILENLQARGKQRCAILGGTSVYTEVFQRYLADELWLTLEPLLFGQGKKLVDSLLDVRLELIAREHLSSSTLLLKYKPAR